MSRVARGRREPIEATASPRATFARGRRPPRGRPPPRSIVRRDAPAVAGRASPEPTDSRMRPAPAPEPASAPAPAPALALAHSARLPAGAAVACLDLGAGARLVTGGGRALALWRWRAGEGWIEREATPRAHRLGVTAARWAPAAAQLASGGVEGELRVWSRALRCRRVLAAPGATAVSALCWAPGARPLAAHDDGTARLWGPRGQLLLRLRAHSAALPALAVLARGELLLTACAEGTLKVYDLVELSSGDPDAAEEAVPLLRLECAHEAGALCAAAAPDERAVATGGGDARVRLWSARARGSRPALRDAGTLLGHEAGVTAVRWGARGLLATASLDRSLRLWAAADRACLRVVRAHERYLTCVALAPDLRFAITGSSDRSFRTWSLGEFSLDAEPQPPCDAMAHFAVGDLEGIGPIEDDDDAPESDRAEESSGEDAKEADEGGGGARCAWRARVHSGAINCIAAHGELLATASSDGTVKVWRWSGDAALTLEHSLEAHRYPALACDFGAAGSVLLTAGLDGSAYLWDVQTGVQVRSLSVPGGGGGGDAGGGGVRGARLSAQRSPRVLLATDDGLAPVWNASDPDPKPASAYGGLSEAAVCCAWSADARICAVGGAGGELRLLAPPQERALHGESHAHDLGVNGCDFAPSSAALEPDASRSLLATAGNDSLIKLWTIELREESGELSARVQLARSVRAHGGVAASVRWGGGERGALLLASAGADRRARVWAVSRAEGGAVRVSERASAPVHGAGGALAALLVEPPALTASPTLLCVGAMDGELALWRLSPPEEGEEEEEACARGWRAGGPAVSRWLSEHASRRPALLRLSGARLLDAPVEEILAALGCGERSEDEQERETDEEEEDPEERAAMRARIEVELAWLREEPPAAELASAAPHALLCPLTHALLRWPTRAADGFTYERDNIREWLLAAPPEGAVSPMTGRRLRNTHLAPNYKLLQTLRDFVRQQSPAPAPLAPLDTGTPLD